MPFNLFEMKISKGKISNIIFFIVIVLLFIPQTRKPIQVTLQKGLALFSPGIKNKSEQKRFKDYNWSLKTMDNQLFDFKSTKGKVVLVSFWATWCPPCIAEMPSMQLLHNDYKNKIEFVFVSNEKSSVINAFKAKNSYTFKIYSAVTEYPEFFNVKTIPRTFLIDKEGYVVIDKSGAANWNSEVVRSVIDTLLL